MSYSQFALTPGALTASADTVMRVREGISVNLLASQTPSTEFHRRSSAALCFAVTVVALAVAATSPVAVAEQSAQSKFLDACQARVDNKEARIDPTVFKDCYTPDFILMGPETHAAKDHAFHGKQAIDAKTRMGGGDSSAWGSVKFWTVEEIESGNKIVRHMHWEAKNPKDGSYAGFTDLPPDMALTDNVITLYTFHGGLLKCDSPNND
jgi:hypothetical protein